MSAIADSQPLTVGLIGVSADGVHFIEAMRGGGPFRIDWACESRPAWRSAAESLRVPIISDLASALVEPKTDVLWLAAGASVNSALLEQVVRTGKPIVAELPLRQSLDDDESMLEAAMSEGRLLLPFRPRRVESDFRHALAAARSGEIGRVNGAKRVMWDYGLAPTGITHSAGEGDRDSARRLCRLLSHTLDQLLKLVAASPISVFALDDSRRGTSSASATTRHVLVVFSDGARADIDIRLASPVRFQSDWLLTGDRGGYASRRIFHLTPDGEVFDSPTSVGDEAICPFGELACSLRRVDLLPSETAHGLEVTRLLIAVDRSLDSGAAVDVNR